MTMELGKNQGGDQDAVERCYYVSEPLIDVHAVAEMCGVSTWMLYKMSRTDRMPNPIRIGRLIRWKRRDIVKWIAGGCNPLSTKKGVRSNG